jgi:hypothetical protein
MSARHRFIGGIRCGGRNASWPLAAVTISDDGTVTVGLRGRLQRVLYGRWLPTTVYRLTDSPEAENVRGGLLGSHGIRVHADGRQVVFWTSRPREVLTALGEHGTRVVWHEQPPKVWIRD